MLIFQNFFSRVENWNSWELDRVSVGISALQILIPRKITVSDARSCVQAWLLIPCR